MSTAVDKMIAEHRRFFEEAEKRLEQRLAAVEEREQKVAEQERWIREKREKIERAIAEDERIAHA
jgi:hypothetical protein